MKPLCAILAFLLAALSAPALEWQTQHQSVKAAPLQKTAETSFEFTNPGSKPVTIIGVDTSCDCTEATPSAKVIAPGAAGTIHARFSLTGAAGTLQRMILVRTDEGESAQLTVELEVPDVARITPRSVEWKLGAEPKEARVEIEIVPGLDVTIGAIRPTSDHFTHRLEVVEPGRHFRLYLAPKSTAKPTNAAIRIYARAANGEDLVFSAYANVR